MRSAFHIKRRLYESAPAGLKGLISFVPFPFIAGAAYREVAASGRGIDRLSRAEVVALKEKTLGEALRFAVDNVPIYKPYRRAVEKLPPVAALREFPLVKKSTILERFEEFVCDPAVRPRHYETTTGGTSGRQLKILVGDDAQGIEMAFMHRQWARVGYTHRARKATFRGVAFPRASEGVFWQLNPVYREIQVSPVAMTETMLPEYWRRIVDFSPEFLHGYPSAISLLARWVIRHGLRGQGPHIRAALLGSEGCTADQRAVIEDAFQTRVFTWYGHSERLVLGGECEHSSDYHQFPDYGWLEILDEQGCEVGVGERGEVVGTGFLNRVMPLIRYRTGDYATRLEPHCVCGRNWDRFTAVEGRWKQEMIVGRDGALLSLAALNVHGPQFARVARYQYYQDTPGRFEIRVVPDSDFTEEDRHAIAATYARKLGNVADVTVRVVDTIPLTSRGKLKLLDSQLGSRAS
jgi:phenylacetate-CoA ligase